jgi:hypothetical protein
MMTLVIEQSVIQAGYDQPVYRVHACLAMMDMFLEASRMICRSRSHRYPAVMRVVTD